MSGENFMKWTLYTYPSLDMNIDERVFIAAFKGYAMAYEAHARFIESNPDIASALVSGYD